MSELLDDSGEGATIYRWGSEAKGSPGRSAAMYHVPTISCALSQVHPHLHHPVMAMGCAEQLVDSSSKTVYSSSVVIH